VVGRGEHLTLHARGTIILVRNKGKGLSVSEEKESSLRKLVFGNDQSESEEKILAYVTHRLKDGAPVREVLQEEYVVRNSTQAQRDKIRQDPRLSQKAREDLEQYFESDELKPEHPPQK
jgi:predicted ATP-dependent endonuclease of OLD family